MGDLCNRVVAFVDKQGASPSFTDAPAALASWHWRVERLRPFCDSPDEHVRGLAAQSIIIGFGTYANTNIAGSWHLDAHDNALLASLYVFYRGIVSAYTSNVSAIVLPYIVRGVDRSVLRHEMSKLQLRPIVCVHTGECSIMWHPPAADYRVTYPVPQTSWTGVIGGAWVPSESEIEKQ